jgi:two-component system, chemotaxis family, sensor histidine kinase and response regulator WspE
MSDLSEFSLLELFQQEAEIHLASLSDGLLRLEKRAYDANTLESLMRAAHSLKGAARMVGVTSAETLAHHMEDYFVGLQKGTVGVTAATIDVMLRGCDQIRELAGLSEDGLVHVEAQEPALLDALVGEIRECLNTPPQAQEPASASAPVTEPETVEPEPVREKTLRMNADRLDSLLSLAGEVQVLTGWLGRYSHRLTNLRTTHIEFLRRLGTITPTTPSDAARILDLHALGVHFSHALSDRLDDLATYERRINRVTTRLYDEVVAGRMRPFGDGVRDLPRRVRDLARSLNKEVELDLQGLDVQVDRDILERLEAPLSHLVRNALDHGIEAPAERVENGKSRSATLSVRAYHRGGMLQVLVEDDGRGIDLDALKARLLKAGTVNAESLAVMSEEELLQFLFLPGFSMRTEVTALSGRGVGLDAARSAAQEMGGMLQCDFWPGRGARFQFSLPITLSVVQCLLVEVAGQPYGLPLSRLDRVMRLQPDQITYIEGRPVIAESLVGLVSAARILELEDDPTLTTEQGLSVVLMSNGRSRH